MSLAELKEKLTELSPDERFELAAYLNSLDEDFKKTLSRRMKDMDAGINVVTKEEVERLHAQLGED